MNAKPGKNVSKEALNRALNGIVGEKHVFMGIEDLIVYAYDASSPAENQLPMAIVSPVGRDEIRGLSMPGC